MDVLVGSEIEYGGQEFALAGRLNKMPKDKVLPRASARGKQNENSWGFSQKTYCVCG